MGLYYTKKGNQIDEVHWGAIIATIIVGIAAIMIILPLYNVWSKELAGKAQLKEAEWNRQIAVQEAQARKESAILDAQAEIERAKGVREANEIIAGSLKGNEEYLRYLWIDRVAGSENVIYVPTEASLPILEAGLR